MNSMVKVTDSRHRRDPKKGRFFKAERPPLMYLAVEIMESSGLSNTQISNNSGLAVSTVAKVRNLETISPHAKTLEFIITKGCKQELAVYNPETREYRRVDFDTYGRKKGVK